MRSDTMSILGLYNYDNTIFDLLTLPEEMNKQILIKNICAELADMELLYPNPEVMKDLIGVWSVSSQYEWEKLYESMLLEYNPLDNYDRTETRTLSSQGTGSGADGGSDQYATTKNHEGTSTSQGTGSGADGGSDQYASSKTQDRTGTHAANNSNSATKGNTNASTEKVAAFNSSTLVDKSQINGTNTDTIQGTDTEQATDTDHSTDAETTAVNYGKTKQETFNKTDTDNVTDTETTAINYGKTKQETFSKTDTETIRARGNIGVTTAMQMLKEQRDIVKFNIYDIITEEFKYRFCILVY